MKKKCELCNRKKNLFEVIKDGKEIKACSICITDQLLTGWSR
jgi:ribosome-binding protein aMBF1 (putative translation factor)